MIKQIYYEQHIGIQYVVHNLDLSGTNIVHHAILLACHLLRR